MFAGLNLSHWAIKKERKEKLRASEEWIKWATDRSPLRCSVPRQHYLYSIHSNSEREGERGRERGRGREREREGERERASIERRNVDNKEPCVLTGGGTPSRWLPVKHGLCTKAMQLSPNTPCTHAHVCSTHTLAGRDSHLESHLFSASVIKLRQNSTWAIMTVIIVLITFTFFWLPCCVHMCCCCQGINSHL